MSFPPEPQVLAAMAVVTHRVKCAAVENQVGSGACRPRRWATAVFRMKQTAEGPCLHQISGGRGFDSKANRELLDQQGIYNAICPRAPGELKDKMKETKFVERQQRRSQTEARISIFKNGFLGSPLLSKGHANQSREVAWQVLTHNLWVIARLPRRPARALLKTG